MYSTDYVASQGYGIMRTCLFIGLGGWVRRYWERERCRVGGELRVRLRAVDSRKESLVSDTVNNILAAQVDDMCKALDE